MYRSLDNEMDVPQDDTIIAQQGDRSADQEFNGLGITEPQEQVTTT